MIQVEPGMRFGRLVVCERLDDVIHNNGERERVWRCICDCGNEKVVNENPMKYGGTRSCGCLYRETRPKKGFSAKHGKSRTRLYGLWGGMLSRCRNPKDDSYPNYGARGITVCDEWAQDFLVFEQWAIDAGYKRGLSLDRIDYNGNYCPENCRWATSKQQCNNRSNNIIITIDGEAKTLAEWCEVYDVPYFTIWSRIKKYGRDPVEALTTPIRRVNN